MKIIIKRLTKQYKLSQLHVFCTNIAPFEVEVNVCPDDGLIPPDQDHLFFFETRIAWDKSFMAQKY